MTTQDEAGRGESNGSEPVQGVGEGRLVSQRTDHKKNQTLRRMGYSFPM